MIVHLIRHGKTEANERRLYCSNTDLPLSAEGERELAHYKSMLLYPAGQYFFHSGLLRTKMTLDFIYGETAAETLEKLREPFFGVFEMQSYEQLKERADYQAWISDFEQGKPPGGESKPHFINRVLTGFEDLVERFQHTEDSLVVVTHGGVIATLMENYFHIQRNFYQWQPACGRGYSLFFQEGSSLPYRHEDI